jgi:hypothetical protein
MEESIRRGDHLNIAGEWWHVEKVPDCCRFNVKTNRMDSTLVKSRVPIINCWIAQQRELFSRRIKYLERQKGYLTDAGGDTSKVEYFRLRMEANRILRPCRCGDGKENVDPSVTVGSVQVKAMAPGPVSPFGRSVPRSPFGAASSKSPFGSSVRPSAIASVAVEKPKVVKDESDLYCSICGLPRRSGARYVLDAKLLDDELEQMKRCWSQLEEEPMACLESHWACSVGMFAVCERLQAGNLESVSCT